MYRNIFFSVNVLHLSFSVPSPPYDPLFPCLPCEHVIRWAKAFNYKCSVLCILMMSLSEAINYKWSSKNLSGSSLSSVVRRLRNGSIKGCTICNWNRREKTEFNIPLDHNALCLSQTDDQRSRKKTYRKSRKKYNNKKWVTKPWEDSCAAPNDGWSVRPLG